MSRTSIPAILSLLALFVITQGTASAQADDIVYPRELYCGENYVAIAIESGIQRIQVTNATGNVLVRGAGARSCERYDTLKVLVLDPREGGAQLVITDCRNRTFVRRLETRSWNVDVNRLGTVELGDTSCFRFQIRAGGDLPGAAPGDPFYVDSITVEDARIQLLLPGHLPVKVNPGQTYFYNVCFASNELGRFKFPVVTWVRRRFPSGGLTTYAVADTGLLTVIPRRRTPPPDTARVVDTIEPEVPVTDPTTFRSVVVPNAVTPPKGRFFAGTYDLLGLTAGYGITDNVMVFAAGALPTPDDWGGAHGDVFGAYSLGLKAGLSPAPDLNIAVGYQFGRSLYDRQNVTVDTVRSTITVHAPYAAISYGSDDSRLSATLGYAFKHHARPDKEFDRNALVFAVGGDYRIARNWKLAGELIRMETVGVMPIVGTVRYFTDRLAIEAGAAYVGITTGDAAPPKIPIAPIVSAIVVF